MEIKLSHPIDNFDWRSNISQLYGVSAYFYQKEFGIPHHNGIDIVVRDSKRGYGTPIKATHDGKIAYLRADNVQSSKGSGVYLQSLDNKFQTVYWHLSEIMCNLGDEIKQGQTIGLMGNTGRCKPKPTQLNPYAGTHLHYALKIFNASNNLGGFVDPVPYMWNKNDKLSVYWARDLFFGKSGDDVAWLQTVLAINGFANDYEEYGYFGRKTLRDVMNLQRKYLISPVLGYVGFKTKKVLQDYSSFYK